jgi:hypothetical protein
MAYTTVMSVWISQLQLGNVIPSSKEEFLMTSITTCICSLPFGYTFIATLSRITNFRYIGHYIFMIGYGWMAGKYGNESWFLLINSLTLMPQIVYNELYLMEPLF